MSGKENGSRFNRDLVGGIAFVLIGGALWYAARDLPRGTALRMGPGYVPVLLSGSIIILGAALAALAAMSRTAASPDAWRPIPVTMILAAIAVFALSIEPLGVLPASMLTGVTSQANRLRQAPGTVMLLSFGIALALTGIFVLALGLPLKALPGG